MLFSPGSVPRPAQLSSQDHPRVSHARLQAHPKNTSSSYYIRPTASPNCPLWRTPKRSELAERTRGSQHLLPHAAISKISEFSRCSWPMIFTLDGAHEVFLHGPTDVLGTIHSRMGRLTPHDQWLYQASVNPADISPFFSSSSHHSHLQHSSLL